MSPAIELGSNKPSLIPTDEIILENPLIRRIPIKEDANNSLIQWNTEKQAKRITLDFVLKLIQLTEIMLMMPLYRQVKIEQKKRF